MTSRRDYEAVLSALLNCDPEYENKTEAMEAFMRIGKGAPEPETDFRASLTALINRFSKENASDTPDFILAGFLEGALELFDRTVVRREEWHGRGARIAPIPTTNFWGLPIDRKHE